MTSTTHPTPEHIGLYKYECSRLQAAALAEIAAVSLLAGVATCIASPNLGWAFGLQLNGTLSLIAAGLAAASVLAMSARRHGGRIAIAAGWRLGLCAALALGMAAVVSDFSYDGQRHHQLAVQTLAQGWNPLRDAPVEGLHALWINGYAKGPWTWSAVWLHATGSVELGKSLHLWLAASAGLLAYGALLRLPGLGSRAALWLALLAAANPVLLYQ
jgi:hypothetical protein